jgi:fibronectin type 3 domain-containing protein
MLNISVVSNISLNWQRPTENVDGTPLTDLIGYRVYYGPASRDYEHSIAINEPTVTSYAFEASSGEYFVAMTAIDADGNESGYSNEVLKLAP